MSNQIATFGISFVQARPSGDVYAVIEVLEVNGDNQLPPALTRPFWFHHQTSSWHHVAYSEVPEDLRAVDEFTKAFARNLIASQRLGEAFLTVANEHLNGCIVRATNGKNDIPLIILESAPNVAGPHHMAQHHGSATIQLGSWF